MRQYAIAKGANLPVVALGRIIACWADARLLAREFAPLFHPLQAPAIHDPGISMPEELKYPERVGRPPIALVAVEDDRRLGRNANAAGKRFESRLVEIIAAQRVIEVFHPVDFDRPGKVPAG